MQQFGYVPKIRGGVFELAITMFWLAKLLCDVNFQQPSLQRGLLMIMLAVRTDYPLSQKDIMVIPAAADIDIIRDGRRYAEPWTERKWVGTG